MLYELGIPVVETGDKWHYDIGQKVPLTLDRENVQPSFLRQIRVAVFNRMHRQLAPKDVNSAWAETAIASPDCAPTAGQVASILLTAALRRVTSEVRKPDKKTRSSLAEELATRAAAKSSQTNPAEG